MHTFFVPACLILQCILIGVHEYECSPFKKIRNYLDENEKFNEEIARALSKFFENGDENLAELATDVYTMGKNLGYNVVSAIMDDEHQRPEGGYDWFNSHDDTYQRPQKNFKSYEQIVEKLFPSLIQRMASETETDEELPNEENQRRFLISLALNAAATAIDIGRNMVSNVVSIFTGKKRPSKHDTYSDENSEDSHSGDRRRASWDGTINSRMIERMAPETETDEELSNEENQRRFLISLALNAAATAVDIGKNMVSNVLSIFTGKRRPSKHNTHSDESSEDSYSGEGRRATWDGTRNPWSTVQKFFMRPKGASTVNPKSYTQLLLEQKEEKNGCNKP